LTFWIDTICIDQENPAEKDDQIPIMREVYHFSVLVLIYLGVSTPRETKVTRFIGDLSGDSISWRVNAFYRWLNEKGKATEDNKEGIGRE
jgi:hypothetical protein